MKTAESGNGIAQGEGRDGSLACFGWPPPDAYNWPPLTSLETDCMTAIAHAFDLDENRFVIAADGRCAVADTTPPRIKSDFTQKIFPVQSDGIVAAFYLTGIAAIGDFELIPVFDNQIKNLAKRSLQSVVNGNGYAAKLFSNMVRVLDNAKKDGRIPGIPSSDFIPPEAKTKKFSIFLLGYFRGKRFISQGEFHYDDPPGRFRVEVYPYHLTQNQAQHTGSIVIGRMIFNPAIQADPRIAHFKNHPNQLPDALTATTNFVKACMHPAASEIDPWCRNVGGHIHAAEVTPDGFRWLTPPVQE